MCPMYHVKLDSHSTLIQGDLFSTDQVASDLPHGCHTNALCVIMSSKCRCRDNLAFSISVSIPFPAPFPLPPFSKCTPSLDGGESFD